MRGLITVVITSSYTVFYFQGITAELSVSDIFPIRNNLLESIKKIMYKQIYIITIYIYVLRLGLILVLEATYMYMYINILVVHVTRCTHIQVADKLNHRHRRLYIFFVHCIKFKYTSPQTGILVLIYFDQ